MHEQKHFWKSLRSVPLFCVNGVSFGQQASMNGRQKKVTASSRIWQDQPTCTIITIGANSLVSPIHERMPVILQPKDFPTWLAPGEQKADLLQECLQPYPAEDMEAYPVSRAVNNPAAEGEELLKKVQC
jgi:putative SOS response-associated peptidase YedK